MILKLRTDFFIPFLAALLVCLLAGADANAEVVNAVVTYPSPGSASADYALPIQWTTVLDAQGYYLYVGTAIGAKDLIDTGEIHQTFYAATGLPANQTVFCRLWTKVAGIWRFTDSSFRGDILTTRIVSPANGATNADWTLPIQWAPIPSIQKYYLYVGTSPGAKDLINSGETTQTSWPATTLPAHQVLYASIWSKVAGVWRSTDSTFSGDLLTARVTSPSNGATNADWGRAIQWTVVPAAEAYYLYVGTTPGASNLINSGSTTQNAFPAMTLPANVVVYARLWTKVAGVWRYQDSSFSGAQRTSTLTFPANGAKSADLTQPIRWTTIPDAQAYYLYVGSTLGARDFVSTGEIHSTSISTSKIPPGLVVYARLWTKLANVWTFSDSTFTALPLKATLIYPLDGATDVAAGQSFRWAAVTNADAYYLYVGSSAGAKDLVNTGEIHTTSYLPSSLPVGERLYARLWTKTAGVWWYSDTTFAMLSTSLRVQSGDLHYLGSFRVPDGDFGSPQYHGFHFGGSALGFSSTRNSLFIVGHSQDQLVAEISIPDVRAGSLSDIATASVLQNFFDPLEGRIRDINPADPNPKLIGGLLPLADRLVVSAYSFYDGLGTQALSHFTRSLTLTPDGTLSGPFQVGPRAGFISGYMATVPQNWRLALGGSALSGNCCLSVIGRTSFGPSVSSISPADLGVISPVPTVPLVGYSQDHQTLGGWDGNNPGFNGATTINGVVFPAGTDSVLFFGRRGLGPFCYGIGTADPALTGTPSEDATPLCFDPTSSYKGTHSYPYAVSVWAYDAHDFAAVRNGSKQAWELFPYAIWDLNVPLSSSTRILGATYDDVSGRIFVSVGFADGDMPLIHVFRPF